MNFDQWVWRKDMNIFGLHIYTQKFRFNSRKLQKLRVFNRKSYVFIRVYFLRNYAKNICSLWKWASLAFVRLHNVAVSLSQFPPVVQIIVAGVTDDM